MRRILLYFGDIATLYLALLLTLVIRYGGDFGNQLDIHSLPFTLIFLIWLLVFYIANLYEISLQKNNISFFSTLFYSIAVNATISVLFFYLIPLFGITPKTNLFIFLVLATTLQTSWRYYFNKLIVKGGYRNNTLIIGVNQQSQELYDFLLANPQLGYNPLGIIDVEDNAVSEILEDLIKQKRVATLVLSPSVYHIPHIVDVFYRLVGFKINFHSLSDFYELATGKVPLGAIDQVWFLENLSESGKRGYEMAKRALDSVFAVVIGTISLPFYPLIILGIKLDSKGPILYRQLRIGKAGKVFSLIKFRTMTHGVEKDTGPVWASENDSRTTRFGKFIRKTRIDELPQVWNVLKGQMSFVGPRPERPEFHEKLQKGIPFYEERYLVRPGLTGWAQIKHKLDFSGGMTILDTAEKLQHDLYYIKHRTVMLDLGVILKTISIILKKAFR